MLEILADEAQKALQLATEETTVREGRPVLEILADEAQKALQLATEETTKVVVPAAVGAAFAGARNLRQVITAGVRVLPRDPVARTAKIVKLAETDPEFRARLYAAVAELRGRGTEVAVPPAPDGFTDRHDVLPVLGAPGIRTVTGLSGWGKTYVVKQVRHDRAEEYADGNAYVDCDAFRSDGALRYAEVFGEVLRQVGVEVADTGDAALSAQYERALLHGRFLLVFDNVDGAAEARALARDWPLSLVLLTAREALGELVAWCPTPPVRLGGLDRAGGRELLESYAGTSLPAAEPQATEQLLDLCDYVPDFLRRAGGTLNLRRGDFKPVARLVAELRDGDDPQGFDGILTSLGLHSLPDAVRADLASLSVHPGADFTRDSATALLGRPAGSTIDTLLSAGLAVAGSGGRLRLLRLVRQRVTPAPGEAEAALRRLLAVTVELATAADHTLEGDRLRPAVIPADLRWRLSHLTAVEYLDLHTALIVDLVQLAHHRELHQDAIRLCGSLEVVLTYLGRHHLIATAIGWGIRSAEVAGDALAAARLYATRARIETDLGLFGEAEASLDTAGTHAGTIDNPRLASSLLEFRARLARERVRRAVDDGAVVPSDAFMEAAGLIERCLEIDRAHDLSRARGIHARELATLLLRAKRPDEAMVLFEEAARHTDAGRPRNLSRIHLGRARVFDLWERWADVDREVAVARALIADSGATVYDIELDDFVAETAWHRGDVETARAGWDRLAERFYTMAHPRYDRYRDRLNQLPPPRR
ncbi:hypothetical protein [Actinoplanes sp. NPDC051494]|uniref:hypothetical protein n=1 Tax=Actinoplanes sp. NPDC051494 TaxID=3363907 RepID=UPI0037B73043